MGEVWFAPDDSSLPAPWKGVVDGATRCLYYWNPETNITQYEKPAYWVSSPSLTPSCYPEPFYSPPFGASDYTFHSQYPNYQVPVETVINGYTFPTQFPFPNHTHTSPNQLIYPQSHSMVEPIYPKFTSFRPEPDMNPSVPTFQSPYDLNPSVPTFVPHLQVSDPEPSFFLPMGDDEPQPIPLELHAGPDFAVQTTDTDHSTPTNFSDCSSIHPSIDFAELVGPQLPCLPPEQTSKLLEVSTIEKTDHMLLLTGFDIAREEYPKTILRSEKSSVTRFPVELVQTVVPRRTDNSLNDAEQQACDHSPLEKLRADIGGLRTLNITFEVYASVFDNSHFLRAFSSWLLKNQGDYSSLFKAVTSQPSTGILEHASAVNVAVDDLFLHLDCGRKNFDYWLMSLPLSGWFEKIQSSVEQVLYEKALHNFLLNPLHSLKCFVDANTLPVYESFARGLGSFHSVLALQMGLYIFMHMSSTTLILLNSGMPQQYLYSVALLGVLWSTQNCKDMDQLQPHSIVIIATVLGVIFYHTRSATHALCYFSSPHCSLVSVNMKLQVHPILRELGLQKHEHELAYLFMTCTVLALSLLMATMFIKDVTGGNFYLIDVVVIHMVLFCQPRLFFVEVIDFPQANLELSSMRYPSGPIFLLPPIDVHSATNIIFQDGLLMTHEHERGIAESTLLPPPFFALRVQWFPVKHLLNQLLAILFGDTSVVLDFVSANSVTKLVTLKYKKEMYVAIFPVAIFYVAFGFFSQLPLVENFRPNQIVESPRHCVTTQETLATFWLWLATTLLSLNADLVLHLHGLIEMWFKLLIINTELNLATDPYITSNGEIAAGLVFNFGATSSITTSDINMDYSNMCLPHLQEFFIEIFAVELLPYCYSMDAGITWCSPLWDLTLGQPSQPFKFSIRLDFQVTTVLMDMYLKSRGSSIGLLIFTGYMTHHIFGNCPPKFSHHSFLHMAMNLLFHCMLSHSSMSYVIILVDPHFGVDIVCGPIQASMSNVGRQRLLDVISLLSFGSLYNETAYKEVSLVTLATDWSTVKIHVLDTNASNFLVTTIVGKAWASLCIFKIPEHSLTRNFQGLLSSVICGPRTVTFKRFTFVSTIAYIWDTSLAVTTLCAIRNKSSQLIDNSVTNIVGSMTLVLYMLAFIVIGELPVGKLLAILLDYLTLHVVFYFTKAVLMEVGQLASQSPTLNLYVLALLFSADDHINIAPVEDMINKVDGHVIFDALITFNMFPNDSCGYWDAKVAFGIHDGMPTAGVKFSESLVPEGPSHVAVHTKATWLEDIWFNFSLTTTIWHEDMPDFKGAGMIESLWLWTCFT